MNKTGDSSFYASNLGTGVLVPKVKVLFIRIFIKEVFHEGSYKNMILTSYRRVIHYDHKEKKASDFQKDLIINPVVKLSCVNVE